ncbi:MAG TPA: EF-hand domain-containing protein [Pseudomonas xinjiangensis]|uniref:EF-hand domain-containing protein n=2 Tax=root TaxID=1 RepID=A0A7V1BPN9_9GAMM|nr:EF-hand domain-containing protein [Halopseudomonas xinjiangensis]HEC49328.1 EF-hand domain-containing protein [Halopseudomonas xinjiangensis]
MNIDLKWFIGTVTFAVMLASAGAYAQEEGFDQLDSDSSGTLERSELEHLGFERDELIGLLDTDDDAFSSDEEFNEDRFERYDTDDSGSWSREEYEVFLRSPGPGGLMYP